MSTVSNGLKDVAGALLSTSKANHISTVQMALMLHMAAADLNDPENPADIAEISGLDAYDDTFRPALEDLAGRAIYRPRVASLALPRGFKTPEETDTVQHWADLPTQWELTGKSREAIRPVVEAIIAKRKRR